MASGDRSARDLELQAARARAATTAEADTEGHLDAVLRRHGYHCLHDCRWPGTRNGIDHVVIGPTGVWIVDDKRLTGTITVDGAGELWTGRVPLAPELVKARAQAVAVDAALGRFGTRAILSIAGVAVPGGAITRDRSVVASALDATSNVIMRGRAHVQSHEVERLAAAARVLLAPHRAAAPSSMLTPKAPPAPAPAREFVAPWATERPVARPQVSRRRKVRRTAKRWLRVVVLVALAWVAYGVFTTAYQAVRDDVRTDEVPASSPLAGAPISVAFECRSPGNGWTAVASWPRLGVFPQVSWSSAPEGPWVEAAAYGLSAVRDGIPPGVRALVRVGGSIGGGQAPDAPC